MEPAPARVALTGGYGSPLYLTSLVGLLIKLPVTFIGPNAYAVPSPAMGLPSVEATKPGR